MTTYYGCALAHARHLCRTRICGRPSTRAEDKWSKLYLERSRSSKLVVSFNESDVIYSDDHILDSEHTTDANLAEVLDGHWSLFTCMLYLIYPTNCARKSPSLRNKESLRSLKRPCIGGMIYSSTTCTG
jgi:hypothetical protein